MKRFLIALMVVPLLITIVGCDDVEKVKGWCATYNAGFNYVQSFAIPALDQAIVLKPAWAGEYAASKALLFELNDQLVSLCLRFEQGQGIRMEDIAPIVAEATGVLARLLSLYQAISVSDFGTGVSDITEREFVDRGVEIDSLMQDLEGVRDEATGALN
ncbi:MAG: hypothetical protein ACXABY_01625 [Candidatus Thorarchaeota archaeon]|jgi:hypothetical protein